ncbi:HTH-type transcriptional regulator CdhR [Massilia sp. Bi118]|uniref:GlxA family transcriptional regulator n=1 Tax=Massilia sp. Bi118 TaxID=2822346 RepID=UPI001DE108C5|nr:GlxA family transcriptional regulator [Massilia sp. Bi118]CAH0177409.1 HTH-type transcriptional regulator CdhR [Massilia sp. Bi118]
MPSIAILAFPGVQALDLSGPMDAFAEANRFLAPAEHYTLRVLGTEPGLLRCSNGMAVLPDALCHDVNEGVDLLMVAGGPELPRRPRDPALSAWLCAMSRRSARIASVCNGAFLLAHAGLLDGRQATTHWNDATRLAARFPRIAVAPDRIFVKDGQVYTSAGVTAGIDMSLYLLYEDHGAELSLNVAKRLVVFTQRSGGQSQFSPFLAPYVDQASPLQTVQQFVLANLGADLSVQRLAGVAAMSERNFGRVFLRDAGVTPGEFVERARIDAARVLLETGDTPLKTVAHRCGFGSAAAMRAAFVKHLGLSARQYRLNFGGLGPASGAPPGAG